MRVFLILSTALLLAGSALAQTEPVVRPVGDPARAARLTQSLQQQLTRMGDSARITSCGPVVDLVSDQGGYDHVFGASCRLDVGGRATTAVMCDDERGARFSLTLAAMPDVETMARFISADCRPQP
ncbi:MAG TPA: hypothetical protein VG248_05585 [Caulobacteraceae bacterium]|nr:hypothetical protein [Caulobacteraceae bacterium]